MLPSEAPLHILVDFSSFSEMPNRALAFGRSCAAGKGGASGRLAIFFTILSVLSTAVGITYRSWETCGEREGGRGGWETEREKLVKVLIRKSKALHGRLAGRLKPPLAGRCNDFAPSRQKVATTKNNRPVPALEKKKTAPRPVPSKKKTKATPSRLGKNKQPLPPPVFFSEKELCLSLLWFLQMKVSVEPFVVGLESAVANFLIVEVKK